MKNKNTSLPWYKDGLDFHCTQCGACCTGSPGYVWIRDDEIIGMAAFLGISIEHFVKKYTRTVFGKRALLEHPKTYDCVFLENNTCGLYTCRPKQCRTYPWWPEIVASKDAWEEESKRCEGINNAQSRNYSLEEIQQQLSLN